MNLRSAAIVMLVFTAAVFAHGEEAPAGADAASQLDELSPLHHLGEGHALSASVLSILWLSFVYAAYALYQKLTARKKK